MPNLTSTIPSSASCISGNSFVQAGPGAGAGKVFDNVFVMYFLTPEQGVDRSNSNFLKQLMNADNVSSYRRPTILAGYFLAIWNIEVILGRLGFAFHSDGRIGISELSTV